MKNKTAPDRSRDVTDPKRQKSVINRNTSAGGLRSIRQNGEQVCELCEAVLATGNGGWGDPERYMRRHLDRCEMSTQAEREHYKKNGKWPNKRLKRSAS